MMIKVKQLGHKNTSVMVEYVQDGATVRKVLSQRDIQDDSVSSETLSKAAPYGVPVGKLAEQIDFSDFGSTLESACRSRGLWTKSDFTRNPALVMAALQEALRLDTARLLDLISASDD